MDNYLDDDFLNFDDDEEYFEPSEEQMRLKEITDILKESVKQDIKAELETLRAENERLREYERTAHENDIRLATELKKLANERVELEKKVKNMRLRKLFGDYITKAWCVQVIYTEKPKCDKCNGNRKIEYKSPRGTLMYEDCECADKLIHYEPKQTELVAIETREQWGERNVIRTYYTAGTLWTTGKIIEDSVERTSTVYNDEPLETINKYYATRYIFLDKSKCEEFCEYLNNKEKENEKV